MSKIKDKITTILMALFLVIVVAACSNDITIDEKPGAMLWGENCGRCHNVRPPSSLTDAEWDLAVLHMKTRANLTQVEAERIAEFLKAGN